MTHGGKAVSKNNKLRRKQKKQQRLRREKLVGRRARAPRTFEVVDQAWELIRRRQWHEARLLLEERDRECPDRPNVLRTLLDVYHHQRDYGRYCRTCRRLLDLEPDNRPLHLMLAGGYLAEACPTSALLAFRRYVMLWPDDPLAEGARESIAQLEPAVEELLRAAPFAKDEQLELSAMHEEVVASLALADHARAIEIGGRLWGRAPDFLPVMNNLSEAYFHLGRSLDAIAMSRRVLEREADNFHALANLARHLLLSGCRDEAEEMCARLRSIRSERSEFWCKKAETLSFFGDDSGVLDALASAERCGFTNVHPQTTALLHHLAAVAHARQGNHRRATSYWRASIKKWAGFDLAKANLADAKQPLGRREGPWPYSLDYWIPRQTIDELCTCFDIPSHDDDEVETRVARQFAESHPELASLVPALLDRGDPAARQLARRFAMLLATPEMHEALCVYCLSQRGADEQRMETANWLCRVGALPCGPLRLSVRGARHDMEMFGFEITGEPISPGHSEQVNEWAYDAMRALRSGHGVRAERLLKDCLEIEPNKPSLLNNLANAYMLQGRGDEALNLIREIHSRWPDYFFGRIAMANLAISEGHYEQAEAYLAPLRQRRRLHSSEFSALCMAYIQISMSRGMPDVARRWLESWSQVDADGPDLEHAERLVHAGRVVRAMSKPLSGRGR